MSVSAMGRSKRNFQQMMMMPNMMHPMMMPHMAMANMPPMRNNMMMGQESESDEEAPAAPPLADQPTAAAAAPAAAPKAAPKSLSLVRPPVPSDETRDTMEITKSATFVRQLPRQRLAENLENICPMLESTMVRELSNSGLLKLLWVLTRIKPCTKCKDLRTLARHMTMT